MGHERAESERLHSRGILVPIDWGGATNGPFTLGFWGPGTVTELLFAVRWGCANRAPMSSFQEQVATVGSMLEPNLGAMPERLVVPWSADQTSRACHVAVALYLCACFLAFDDGMRVLLVLGGSGFILWRRTLTWSLSADSKDIFRRLAAHFLCWMTARSLFEYGRFNVEYSREAGWWLFGTFLLVLFSWLVWEAARNAPALAALGRWVGLSAALAAAASFLLFYGILPNHVIGERLQNCFIYGGMNPVSTGLTFGFAALWLVCLSEEKMPTRERALCTLALVVLLTAVLFTRSRGALLALLAGYTALTYARGVRRMATPWVLLATLFTLFILGGPLVSCLAARQAAAAVSLNEPISVEHLVLQRMQSPPPVREMVERRDSGRLLLYRHAARTLTTPMDWIFGVGQWGPGEFSSRGFGINHNHLHSGFFATLVHGGIIGLTLLLAMLSIGLRRAGQLAKQGHDVWLALLIYGCAGLLFDGQTLTTLNSLPQMETLLFAFPLVAAASIGAREKGAQERPGNLRG